MEKLFLVFTTALTLACAPTFDPDLSSVGGIDSGTGEEDSGGDDTGADTSSDIPDMGGDSTGDEETDSTEDTGEEGYCGDGILNGDEECDMKDLGGEDCWTLGYPNGGALSCSEECVLIPELSCSAGYCGDQPETGNYSACEANQHGDATCGDPSLYCATNVSSSGVCSKTCQNDTDCAMEGYEGCGGEMGGQACRYPPGESQARCFILCGFDFQCPNSMVCEPFPPFYMQSICM